MRCHRLSTLCRLWLVDRRGCELPRAQLVATAYRTSIRAVLPTSVALRCIVSALDAKVPFASSSSTSAIASEKATGRRDSHTRPPLWPFVASPRSKATTGHPTAMYSATFVKVGEGDEEEEVRTGPDAGVGRYQLFSTRTSVRRIPARS